MDNNCIDMKIEFNEKLNCNHILPENGMVITDWDKEDILMYSSCKELYCPKDADLSGYYEIPEEEDEKYMQQQIEILMEIEKRERGY